MVGFADKVCGSILLMCQLRKCLSRFFPVSLLVASRVFFRWRKCFISFAAVLLQVCRTCRGCC